MDIESLKTFITLANLKSFTKTAEQHFIVQSTVTNRIMELEKELGKKLFIRDKKNVTLTEEGAHLLSYAKRIVELEETAIRELNIFHTFSGTLCIGSVSTVYDCHLYPFISTYMSTHKDISIKTIISHSNDLLCMLHDDTIDVCFTYIPLHKPQFQCLLFRCDTLVLVTHPSNKTYPSGIKKSNLINLDYLYCDFVINEGCNFIRDLFPKHYPFAFEVDNGTKLIPYLVSGMGYSFMPKSLIQNQLDQKLLVEIPLIDFAPPKIYSYIIINKKNSNAKAISDWMDLMNLNV